MSESPSLTRTPNRDALSYDPETGIFTWLNPTGTRVKKGQVAGFDSGTGYRQVEVDGVRYYLHRLAFFYMTGKMPDGEVDHINRDKKDNRWANLRTVTRSRNELNKGVRIDSRTNVTGVSFNKRKGRYVSYASIDGSRVHLGSFASIDEAKMARAKWEQEHLASDRKII